MMTKTLTFTLQEHTNDRLDRVEKDELAKAIGAAIQGCGYQVTASHPVEINGLFPDKRPFMVGQQITFHVDSKQAA